MTQTINNAIEIKNLTKKYPRFKLDNVSLEIPSGVIVGLIGENGVGKTTLIKSILGIIHPDAGEIKLYGQTRTKNPKLNAEINTEIGVVLDNIFFPRVLTPQNVGKIMRKIFESWDEDYFRECLEKMGISEKQILKTMSKGMRKQVEIATALAHQPKLLILDEPTSGLDPPKRYEILDLFQEFVKDEEHTILFSTHITSDLERIADQIVFVDKGKLILNKTRDEIIDDYGILKVDLADFGKIDPQDIVRYIKGRYHYEILVDDKKTVRKKYADCVIDKITLEDLMVQIIKGEKGEKL